MTLFVTVGDTFCHLGMLKSNIGLVEPRFKVDPVLHVYITKRRMGRH